MRSIWMGIQPERECTRVIAMAGPGAERTLLKARLAPSPASRRALPALLEAVALWQGQPVRAALVADTSGDSCGTSLFRDSFPDFRRYLRAKARMLGLERLLGRSVPVAEVKPLLAVRLGAALGRSFGER